MTAAPHEFPTAPPRAAPPARPASGTARQAAAPAFACHDHAACRREALARAEAALEGTGARLTPVRRKTLEILLSQHRAFGAYEVLQHLAEAGFPPQPPTAYRALEFLRRHGLAHSVQRLNAFAACACPGTAHSPVFLICESCHAVAETPAPPVQEALQEAAQALGFRFSRASVELAGLCPACAA